MNHNMESLSVTNPFENDGDDIPNPSLYPVVVEEVDIFIFQEEATETYLIDFLTNTLHRIRLKLDSRQHDVLTTLAGNLPHENTRQLFDYMHNPHGHVEALFNSFHEPNYIQKRVSPRQQNVLRALLVAMTYVELRSRGLGLWEVDSMSDEDLRENISQVLDNDHATFSTVQCDLFRCFRVLDHFGLPARRRGAPNKALYVMICGFLAGTKRSYTLGGLQNDEVAFLCDVFSRYFSIPPENRPGATVAADGMTDTESVNSA